MNFLSYILSSIHKVDIGRQDLSTPVESKEDVVKKDTDMPKYGNPEIQALSDALDGLKEGPLTIELQRLLQIVPRQRKRSDAYTGLKKELEKMNVNLIITSRKSKGGNNESTK